MRQFRTRPPRVGPVLPTGSLQFAVSAFQTGAYVSRGCHDSPRRKCTRSFMPCAMNLKER